MATATRNDRHSREAARIWNDPTETERVLLQRIARAECERRGLKLPEAAPNVYQRSFLSFLRDCVWTIDKARAGEERPWPTGGRWDDYWEDWETVLLCCSPLLIDKTRRTMASNVICAFDLWIAAGGSDPRWPSLARSQRNRSVLIQAQKQGKSKYDEGCSAEFVTRIQEMVRVMESHELQGRWTGFPSWQWGFGVGFNANSGKILAIPEGPDQVRGPGTTFLHGEELSAWEQAMATLEVALPSIHPEGHAVFVTTPAVGTFAQRIRNGEIGAGTPPYELPKLKTLHLRQAGSWYVLEIRGVRDIPGYVIADIGKGMSPGTIRRELEGDWTASSGKVVFEEYGDVHEPVSPLPFDPQRPLVCGWDLPAATGGTPAFVATQVSGAGQWCIYGSLLPGVEEAPGVWEFSERVAAWLEKKFAVPAGVRLQDLKLVHYGDPAGNQRGLAGGKGGEIRSANEIIRGGDKIEQGLDHRGQPVYVERPGRGWIIQPGEVSSIKRIEGMKQRLMLNVRGAPALVVAGSATHLREGFRGAYCYKQRQDGQYELDPQKNRYSHDQEALQYVCSRLFLHRPEVDPVAEYLKLQRAKTPATRGMGAARRR